MIRLPTLLLLVTMASVAHAQAGRPVRLSVFADSVSPGERVAVAIAVDHAAGVQTLFPAVPALFPEAAAGLTFGDAEALSVRRLAPRVRGSARTDSAVYTVAVFAVDRARVGPVAVRQVRGTDTTTVESGVAVVPVRSVAQATDDPGPPGPPDPFPSPVPLLAAIVASLFAALAGLVVWSRRRRRRAPAGTAAPPLAPYPAALARLDALDRETPATPSEVEAHVDALEETQGVYVSHRLGLPSMRLTTDELADRLGAVAWLPDDARSRVRGVLRVADLVDFAALRPGADAVADARSRAREAVERVEAAAVAHETPAALPPPDPVAP